MTKILEAIPKESWIHRWNKAFPFSEVPYSFVVFTGLSYLGACLGRKTYIEHDVYKLWPMLNVLLIGPSGVGKTTSMLMGKPLLDSLPLAEQPQVIGGAPSPEKLHFDLRPQPKTLLTAYELAAFFGKQRYQEALVPYVTELLDYGDVIERRTKSGGIIAVNEPSVTIIGASTLQWLQEMLPDSAVSGGFLARFLIIEEGTRRQRKALPTHGLTAVAKKRLQEYREKVSEEFWEIIDASPDGEIQFKNFDVQDRYTLWYNAHKPLSGFLEPFAARAGANILRLSMLIAISCKRKSISLRDMDAGIALYLYTEKKLREIVVPYSPKGKLLAMVLQLVEKKPLTDKMIKRNMRNFCTANEVGVYIDSLLQTGEIRRRPTDKKIERVLDD